MTTTVTLPGPVDPPLETPLHAVCRQIAMHKAVRITNEALDDLGSEPAASPLDFPARDLRTDRRFSMPQRRSNGCATAEQRQIPKFAAGNLAQHVETAGPNVFFRKLLENFVENETVPRDAPPVTDDQRWRRYAVPIRNEAGFILE